MSIVAVRLNKEEETLFKDFASLEGVNLSTLLKKALIEMIEDRQDYETGIKALEEHKKHPVTYTADEILEELANGL